MERAPRQATCNLDWAYLGRMPYTAASRLQQALSAALVNGTGRPTLLLLEHSPTITLGRRSSSDEILVPREKLAKLGVAVVATSRGGGTTYHGPGQLVGYPVVDLGRLSLGARAYVLRLAHALQRTLRAHRIDTEWSDEHPGLWLARSGQPEKIVSLGVHVRRNIATHGFALNVQPELAAFEMIVPCGIQGSRMISMASVSGELWELPALASEVAASVAEALGLAPREVPPEHMTLATDFDTR